MMLFFQYFFFKWPFVEYRLQTATNKIAVTIYSPEISTVTADYSICECNQSYPDLTKLNSETILLPIETNTSSLDSITVLFEDYNSLVEVLSSLPQFGIYNINILAHSIFCPTSNGGCR